MKISNFKFQISNKKGFTLIELLVVIAIIGILATLLMSNFIGIRQRARDGKRKSDISQLQAALEQYRADNGSYYTGALTCGSQFSITNGSNQTIIYMKTVPCDPLEQSGQNTYNNGSYAYYSDGSIYDIGACLENSSDPQGTTNPPQGGSGTCSTNTYFIVNNP
ncbi:MAG: prepilin-type N-terminal cleavage/methylation domain-containing protein [Patescibacteria group bacterium]|nr:prepilin-type N-terminal cleavage/methylation domain-containing protein [Patescibacteria group bacterium]